ncbi:hecd-1 [Symbiodinium natans]|uniref:Hecd-1 protein n=1 Tax=Symbiodinium natans TaxID=878477 RepID=A0A812J5F3_9DINO|nr:hecd-1 [Symbiodinium natans]
MAPTPEEFDASVLPDRPCLLNEKFKVHSYDGGAFKSKGQYDIKNSLVPLLEPFHCSSSGTKFNLVLKCSDDFTLTHFYVSGPGQRCTEPVKSGLVWVLEQAPDVERLKKYDSMCAEELLEIVKGLRTYSSSEQAGSVPDPCLYFTTDPSSREIELELPKWREGKYVVVKFLDTHKDQGNIDVGIVGMIGYFGRHAKKQIPLGPWMKRKARQVWVHPNELQSMFSSSGWVCDGRDFTGGCRSGQTDFHQTNVYTVTFRCTNSGFDLCEKCAHDPTLGHIAEDSIRSDLEALADPSLCKLGATRLRNLWRRNWAEAMPRYFAAGLLDSLVQALQKCLDGQRPEEERVTAQRQQPGAENQKRQARRALLQLTMELTQRLLGLGCGETGQASNDLVWAIRTESEGQEQWDEGRVVQLPKSMPESLTSRPLPPPKKALAVAVAGTGGGSGESGEAARSGAGGESGDTATAATENTPAAAADRGEAEATQSDSAMSSKDSTSQEGCYLISWRDGQAPSWVHAQHVWRMVADEDVMIATAGLFLELAKGAPCDTSRLSKLLQQGADLQALNGEGCTALLLAVRAEVPVEALKVLLEHGACPDAAGREGVTPLELILRKQRDECADGDWLRQCAEALRQHKATLEASQEEHAARVIELQKTFGVKMVGALLSLASPLSLPAEILEVLHLLFRELPLEVVQAALEPQAFCALTTLLQHVVGGTDNLSVALLGCRIMKSMYQKGDAKLQHVVRSHGAERWAKRISVSKDVALCGIYRQAHNEKVTVDELSQEAQSLLEELQKSGEGESENADAEWRTNEKLVEVVDALAAADESGPGRLAPAEGLFALRELLKKTEKGSIDEERCTAFELEKADVPGQMLRFLKTQPVPHVSSVNEERWKLFVEAFGDFSKQSKKGLTRFMKAMHAVIETGEALPVWRHKKDRGLKALTEPVSLKLRNLASGIIGCPLLEMHLPKQVPALSVAVEPLVQLADLSNFLTKVTPCIDDAYLQFCHRLIGNKIWDHQKDKIYEVVAFEIFSLGLPIPVHTVRADDEDNSQSWLLANRSYSVMSISEDVPDLELKVALNQLQALTRAEDFVATLDSLEQMAETEAQTSSEEKTEAQAPTTSEDAKKKVMQLASQRPTQVLELIRAEKTRCAIAGDTTEGGDAAGEQAVDPSMRVHTVMIAVSDEIPFELFWPMVKDDIVGAVRELCPRGMPGMEEAVQAGVANDGMGPIAQKLTQQEAENLATRVGHVVQTAVTVDQQALQEAQKEKAKSQQNEPLSGLTSRIQFTPNGDKTWIPGTVVGQLGERFSLVDDKGVLHDKLPRARIRLPPGKRDSTGSAGGAPIQAVLSQADLVRIREHLRRRQEEWAERHAQNSSGTAGAGERSGNGGDEAGAAGSEQRTPTSSRPTSAPAVAALMHRSRASSAPSIDGAVRRGMSMLSREGSLSEVDATSGALDVVQFMEDEGIGDDDFDEEGPGDDGDEDDEDLPPLEAHEAESGLAAGRLGASRGSDGENREFGIGEAGSMEEELRMLEQLRAMEQIISEVLDPSESSRLRRPAGDSAGDDLFTAPMASLRIRMGGGGDLRVPVETCQIRRAGNKGASEPLRGEFPSFVRSADSANATSTLDHPVVERLGASDLTAAQNTGDDPVDAERGSQPPQFSARFCLFPREESSSNTVEESTNRAHLKSIPLPRSWNLLKAMQFLQDQSGVENLASACAQEQHTFVVEPLQKVPLDNWCLGYELVLDSPGPSLRNTEAQVDGSPTARRTPSGEEVALGSGKKRRRTLPVGELTDAVAREMYSDESRRSPNGQVLSLEQMIERCGGNTTVTNAIELLRMMHTYAPSLSLEMGSWVSSKLDRKLRYQLEDPLSVISGTLPMWAVTLPRLCPFLFSLKTRKMLLKYTAFGPSFAVHWTQESKVGSFLKRRATVQTELNAQTDPRKMQELSQELSNIEEHVVRSNFWLGTLQSTLVRLQKGEEFLRQSDVAMGFLANASKLLEVQFEGETGFGVAVTQSFYVEVAQALQERIINTAVPMWVEDDDSSGSQQHLLCRKGLLLKPLTAGPQRDAAVERFRFLGRLMGQALREGFIVPLPLAEEFFALVLGEKLGPDSLPRPGDGVAGELLGALADFAEDLKVGEATQKELVSSPEQIQKWKIAQADRKDFAERFLTPSDRADMTSTQEPMSFNDYTSLAGVCFLETGLSGAALCPDGDNILVTADNVATFVEQATSFWFDAGVKDQVDAFRSGLNDVFPFPCLQAFGRSELREMFCGEDRIEWDEQALLNHIHPTGGLNDKSPAYRFLVAVLLELNQSDRSRFLDFVSSCPRLPPGGIAKFHVDVFPDTSASRQAFPRSRACANQLYLPPYTSKEELQARLHEAMYCSAGHHEQKVRDQ